MYRAFRLSIALMMLLAAGASAHPVPRRSHDRTVTVRLTPSGVVIEYLLEVDEWTVVYVDLPAVSDKVDLGKLTKPAEFHDAFARVYGDILAKNLTLQLDGKELELRCTRRDYRVADHFQCAFRFEARWRLDPKSTHTVSLQEGNYELESGMIRLGLSNHPDLPLRKKTEPDEALKDRPAAELKPGDEERLRRVSATFEVSSAPERRPPGDHICVGRTKH